MSPASKNRKAALSEGLLSGVVGFHVARARVTTQALFQRHIGEPFGLRPVEYSLLMLLQANPALTPKQLAGALALSAPLLTGLLDRIEERALIERVRNTADRRSQLVRLTARGDRFVEDLARRTPEMESELGRSLSTAERAMLIELLDKVARPPVPTARPHD
jgi:DNA-binding MarR family transcriptional regulator